MTIQAVSAEFLVLVAQVNEVQLPKILTDLANSAGNVRGVATLTADVVLRVANARKLHLRFRAGKYEADERERGDITALCDWLQAAHVLLHGGEIKPVKWQDSLFCLATNPQLPKGQTALPVDAYGQITRQIRAGAEG
jgi:hypothetical protein